MMITLVLSTLFAGLAIGLVIGFICLSIDRSRKKPRRILNIKDGITLEYDCSQPGIYEKIKDFIDDR